MADNIDNSEYWHWREPGRAGKEQLDPYDVPNLVPPFSSFWLEWKWYDPDIRRMGNIIGGALVECFELPEEERKRPADRSIFRVLPFAGRTDGLWHSVWAAARYRAKRASWWSVRRAYAFRARNDRSGVTARPTSAWGWRT